MVRAAKSLDVALAQYNALAPKRKKDSDGGAASTGHHLQNPTSDHEPDINNVYHARDFTRDVNAGFDIFSIAGELAMDPRSKYVIANELFYDVVNGKLRVRRYRDVNLAGWRNNPHIKHLHLSVRNGTIGELSHPWPAFGTTTKDNAVATDSQKLDAISAAVAECLQRLQGLTVPSDRYNVNDPGSKYMPKDSYALTDVYNKVVRGV